MPARTTSLDTIMCAAIEIASTEARAAFLADACGEDDALRRRIEELVAAHFQAGSFLESPIPGPSETLEFRSPAGTSGPNELASEAGPRSAVGAGSIVGPYRLLEPIGEGGMGVVYMAAQNAPVRRMVALKVIKPGMDSWQVVARFEAERQALALMDHPNIARVLEAGTTDSGQPYFVMELVRGLPITDYCDRARVPLAGRLELFVLVCRAVQHAHQKGIIHRDIKPSNVLVTLHDGVPVPKVIDFGVAKATGQALTEKTLHTGFAQLVGTPLYMSPEQAEFSGLDIDTRSDIYSLGVLLYELLTGTTPFDSETLRKAAFDEMRRMIREDTPPKPSTRLSALDDTLATVSANRNIDPRKLPHAIRGELDWIAMKALEKDRRRRYDTAGDFAADVMRHLSDRPVEACPPSVLYRFGKLARRNGVALTTASLLATALVLGTAVSTTQALRASQAERKTAAVLANVRGLAEQGRLKQVQLNAIHGARLIDEGDLPAALPRFVEVLRLDGQDPARAETHRIRLAAMLDQCPKPTQIWFHDQQVSHAEFRPDGRAVLSASWDGTVLVRDVGTGAPIGPPLRHDDRVWHAGFSPDGRRVVTACSDHTARVWEVASGRQVVAPLKHDEKVRYAAFHPHGRWVLTGELGTFRIWDTATGELTTPPIKHSGFTSFSPDGRLVVTGGYDRTARLWDAETGAMATPPLKHNHGITFRSTGPDSFSPDGRRLATSCMDHAARIWDTATGKLVVPPLVHAAYVRHAGFSPDGRRLLTASDDGTARLWDAATGAALGTPMEHGGAVMWAAYSPDGTRLVTSSVDRTARVWDAATGRPLLPPLRHLSAVDRATFSPDGRFVLTRSSDCTVRLWDLATAAPVGPRLLNDPVYGSLNEFSSDGRTLATIGPGGLPRFWDVATGAPAAHPDVPVIGGSFSPDGRSFLIITHDVTSWVDISVWDLAARKISAGPFRHQLKKPYAANPDKRAVWSPDGQRVATAAGFNTIASRPEECEVRIWDVRTGMPITPVVPHEFPIFGLEFSPDGRFLATASGPARDEGQPGEARILVASTGQSRIPPIRTPQACRAARFTPDGTRLVTACGALNLGEGEARVWDATSGRPVSPPMQHTGAVVGVAFGPDGRRVLTASEDGTACLWDATTGVLLVPPLRHRRPVDQAQFSRDGRRVLTVSNPAYSHAATEGGPYYAQVWDAATGHPLTPPLKRERFIHHAAFSPDGHRVASTSLRGGGAMLWTLEPDRRPFDDLIRLAEVLSGTRLDASGAAIPLQAEELRTVYEALRGQDSNSFTASRAQLLGWHQQQFLLCEAAGQGVAALAHLDRVIEMGPDVAALNDRRQALRAALKPEEMIAVYRDAIRREPDDPGVHHAFALALQGKGLHDEAIAEFRAVVRLKPTDVRARSGIGGSLRGQGKLDEAIAVYREAIRLEPNNAALHDALAAALGGKGLREQAIEEYREAIRLEPIGSKWARSNLVWLLANAPETRLRNPDEALEHALKGVEITEGKEPGFYEVLALAEYRSGHWEEVLAALEKARTLGGTENALSLFLRAMVHAQMGNKDQARPWFDKAVVWMKAQTYQAWDHRRIWAEAAELLGQPGLDAPAAKVSPK